MSYVPIGTGVASQRVNMAFSVQHANPSTSSSLSLLLLPVAIRPETRYQVSTCCTAALKVAISYLCVCMVRVCSSTPLQRVRHTNRSASIP
jgi:hypothetical protein